MNVRTDCFFLIFLNVLEECLSFDNFKGARFDIFKNLTSISLLNFGEDTEIGFNLVDSSHFLGILLDIYNVFHRDDLELCFKVCSIDFVHASYQGMVERVIVPYFRKRNIKLVDLKATDLQDFYTKQLERVKANSVIHYHANIHKALKYAVKIDLIPTNPADKVERPKKNEFKGSYYSAEEIHALTEVAEGTKLEIPVLLASFYGLRRSEVLGLKWDAIDFEANTLEIKHIVTQASIDGKKVLVQADRAKTKSSLRTLPLVPHIRDRLLMLKGQQDTYRRLCGKSYNRDYLGYLCVDEIGNIIRPNYVSEQFPKLLEKNGLRPIRFHDLRHSCASLLLANGVPMKQIQEWLGHSDFSTTANIYAHLDYASKLSSAQAMLEGLGYGNASA